MLKKSASDALASFRPSSYRSKSTGGKVTLRSHVIEVNGSSEAWYIPPRSFTCYGLVWDPARLGAPELGGREVWPF
jgi:hypothetical protein